MNFNWLKIVMKGIWVGSTMTVPGVSGGTMAIVIGIYEDLISSVNGLRKDARKNIPFILQFVIGAGIGFLLFAKMITGLLERAETNVIVKWLFFGIVLGGIPLLVRKSKIEKLKWNHIIYLLVGAGVVCFISLLPMETMVADNISRFWMLQIVAGLIVAIALILPGISVTHMLYIMGLYEIVIHRMLAFQFISLLPLMMGIMIGVLFATKLLEERMRRYPDKMYMMIIGFVTASLIKLIPQPMKTTVWGAIAISVGFIGMYLISKKRE